MLSFLKVFVRGIVCTILLPVILVVWVLYGVYCLIAFFVMLVKSIILFFAGDNPTGEMKEDIEARRILLEAEQSKADQAQMVNMMYQNMATQQQMFNQQMMQQQSMPQQPVFPQPQQPQNDFNPFTEDPIPENPLPNDEPIQNFDQPTEPKVEEGEPDDGQSY